MDFKKKYCVDCYAALHHNKRKTNFHIHLIFAERTKLEKPVVKVAARNMFYDERGKYVCTKKRYWMKVVTSVMAVRLSEKARFMRKRVLCKDDRFKQDSFRDEAKVFLQMK